MWFIGALVILAWWLMNSVKIVKEYERVVIFRLGKIVEAPRGPGLIFIFFPIETGVVVSMRLVTLDVPPQDVITKDNVSVKVNAVAYFRVMDPIKAIVEVQNYQYATSQMAQTTLRSVLGEMEMDDLLAQRERINDSLQTLLDKQTDPWGIKVTNVEVKHVDISEELRRAMARQAEAERERRAKIIAAEGEFQAAEKICQAAEMMQKAPMSLQLRYLQTLVEIGGKNNTTTLFPIPVDLIQTLISKKG
ncbi:MAG TPA: slipin family protein, partial [Candidatus Omnitrophota bacterium]|jgi:regulator of protease activity HflC (stomatin/prohibitin superfamily)|nr:slipin family protein [Candidatus Omnitrophota bacterium]HPN56561.1 slipin family protein [Candidatus Omnitrophota bacterium]